MKTLNDKLYGAALVIFMWGLLGGIWLMIVSVEEIYSAIGALVSVVFLGLILGLNKINRLRYKNGRPCE